MVLETYDQALNFIHGRTQFKKIPTLTRMRKLMHLLGDPQDELTMVHVTGTNGKGSTVAFLRSMLMAAGYEVGTFTSPFITRFNERISLNNQPIEDQLLVQYTNRVKVVVDQLDQTLLEGGPTEFEIITAIMFLYFKDVDPDIVVVEVGIGGLYDSTNVIVPVVSAITTIGYDHMKILGNTLGEIASQKAGIIKHGVPVVIGQLPKPAQTVIEQTAKQMGSQVLVPGTDYLVHQVGQNQMTTKIEYVKEPFGRHLAELSLFGDYQVGNAGVAITTFVTLMTQLKQPVDWDAVRQGLGSVTWPARMEVVNEQPLIMLDGAHNLPAMQALKQTIIHDFTDRDVYLLVAILADKQTHAMIEELNSLSNVHLTVTTFAGPKVKRPGAEISQLIDNQVGAQIKVADDWQTGLVQLVNQMSSDDVLIITGSLYFVSDVRHYFKD